MRYIKKFESMEISREEILDFFGYNEDDILEVKNIDFYKERNSLKWREGIARLHKIDYVSQRFLNLFNDKKVKDLINSKSSEFCIIDIDIYHPKRVRGAAFAYENFIKTIIKNKCVRAYNGYDIECFIGISRVNPYEDPIAKVFVLLISTI